MATVQANRRRIKYVPPEDDAIRNYASDVCEALAEQMNDPSIAKFENVHGLTNFMRAIAEMEAKRLTAEAEKAWQKAPPNDEDSVSQE